MRLSLRLVCTYHSTVWEQRIEIINPTWANPRRTLAAQAHSQPRVAATGKSSVAAVQINIMKKSSLVALNLVAM